MRRMKWSVVVGLAGCAVLGAVPRDGGTSPGPNEAERACGIGAGVNLLADRSGPEVPARWRRAMVEPDAGDVAFGPLWTTTRGEWAAAIVWPGGKTARLVLAHGERDGGLTLETAELEAGWSDRYGEAFAPELRSTPVIVGGRPFPVITTDTMGGGGGGGARLSIVLPAAGGLVEQTLGSVGGATDINSEVTTGKNCTDALRARRLDDGTSLLMEECFDGRMAGWRCYRWDGRAIVERATTYR